MRRSKSYNEELSHRLKKPAYAKEFITSLMEGDEGLSLADAVRQVISIMGVKEYSELSGLPSSNLVTFIKGRRNPKIETLDELLKPFKLKTKITIDKAS